MLFVLSGNRELIALYESFYNLLRYCFQLNRCQTLTRNFSFILNRMRINGRRDKLIFRKQLTLISTATYVSDTIE